MTKKLSEMTDDERNPHTGGRKHMSTKEKLNGEVIYIVKDDKIAVEIVWYYTKVRHYMSLKMYRGPNSAADAKLVYADACAGGYGYNKYVQCLECVLGRSYKHIEAAYGVTFVHPYSNSGENTDLSPSGGSYAWGNYWQEMLAKAGFKIYGG